MEKNIKKVFCFFVIVMMFPVFLGAQVNNQVKDVAFEDVEGMSFDDDDDMMLVQSSSSKTYISASKLTASKLYALNAGCYSWRISVYNLGSNPITVNIPLLGSKIIPAFGIWMTNGNASGDIDIHISATASNPVSFEAFINCQ